MQATVQIVLDTVQVVPDKVQAVLDTVQVVPATVQEILDTVQVVPATVQVVLDTVQVVLDKFSWSGRNMIIAERIMEHRCIAGDSTSSSEHTCSKGGT
jgi:hypothetical protein